MSTLDQLLPCLAAVRVASAERFSLAGIEYQASPWPGKEPQAALIAMLQELLYEKYYAASPNPAPEAAPETAAASQAARDFHVRRLFIAAAAAGPERWDGGWTLNVQDPQGVVWASKNGLTRAFAPGQYSAQGMAQGSSLLQVKLVRGSLVDQADFFYVHGTHFEGQWSTENLFRLYFHLRPQGVLSLFATLPARLERFAVPFRLKTLVDPALTARRTDATVLFFERRHAAIVLRLCCEAVGQMDRQLMPAATPPFTRTLAPGLALAEDPGSSFGVNRCRLMAEALWSAHALGRADTEETKLAEARRIFLLHGLDPERLYLNPGSADLVLPHWKIEGPE